MRLRYALFTLIAFGCAAPTLAQESSAVLAARQHIQSLSADAFSSADLADLHPSDSHFDRPTGATYVYLAQRHAGIEIWGAIAPAAVLASGKVHAVAPRFQANLAARVSATRPTLASGAAEALAKAHLSATTPALVGQMTLSDEPGETVPTPTPTAYRTTESQLVYQPTEDGALRLAWALTLDATNGSQLWAVRVDALTGTILAADDLVARDQWPVAPLSAASGASVSRAPLAPEAQIGAAGSYRVVAWPAESPNHGPYEVVANPADDTASQRGWHSTGTQEFTTTRGNNVWAYLDRDDDERPDANGEPDGGASLIFDAEYDFEQEPVDNVDAAVTNLFYWGNIFHDITYRYGFDEVAGNFQVNNFGLGGVGNDAARLETQSGSDICNESNPCVNNANFATPSDGGPGRMQMYEWTATFFEVTSPASVARLYPSAAASFGPERLEMGLLVTAQDASGSPSRGCTAAAIANASEVSGNIALIERGGCNFVDKVRNAEAAGAIAAVVYNNDRKGAGETGTPEDLVNMGLPAGAVDDVGIPSSFVQNSTGLLLRRTPEVQLSVGPRTRRGSSMDSGVILHEFGHGLSNRLTGGASRSGCLSNQEQMGEGWSDYYGLLLTMQTGEDIPRGIGTYLEYEETDGRGIRPARYTRDFASNSLTYQSVISGAGTTLSIPHGLGTVWATVLWDMTLDLVDQYGFDADAYNAEGGAGNQIALNLVTQGLKLQPCQPGFVDGRDAILAADQALYEGANRDLIWAAFARRGLGVNASQGASTSATDGTADFSVPAPIPTEDSPNASGATLVVSGANPARGTTALALTLAAPEAVTVEVLDLLGRSVRTLHAGPLAASRHTLELSTDRLAPGVYVVRAQGETFSATQRVTVVR